MFKSNVWFAGAALLAALCVGNKAVAADDGLQEKHFSSWVSERGEIMLPEDFRKTMTHLGSWFVPEGGAAGFHDVYASPEMIAVYRETGEFPEGTVLIKELRAAIAGDYSTGQGVQRATEKILQTFVMIKDRQNRFSGLPQWGDGWGWALFKPGTKGNVSSDYKADCLGCHLPARNNDWVYIEGYPTLK